MKPRSLGRVNVSPVTIASRATAASKSSTVAKSNQSSLSQYFKKVGKPQAQPLNPVRKEVKVDLIKPVRSPPNAIQKVAGRSPSPFSTPSQSIPPRVAINNELYDAYKITDTPIDSMLMHTNYNRIDDESNENISPVLIQTPLQSKIIAERQQRNGDVNGFITAKSICKKDIQATPMQSVSLHSRQAVGNAITTKKAPAKTVSNEISPHIEDFSEDVLRLLFDEENDIDVELSSTSSAGHTVLGLANANGRKPTNDNTVLKALNLNVTKSKSNETNITNDFDDDSSDDEYFNAPNLLNEKYLSFFSPNSSRNDDDQTCATVHTSPTVLPLLVSRPSPPKRKSPMQNTISTSMHTMPDMSKTKANPNRYMPSNRSTNGDSRSIGSTSKFPNVLAEKQQQQYQKESTPTKRVAPRDFEYDAPRQMQSNLNHSQHYQQQQQQSQRQQNTDTIVQKRQKLSIEHVLSCAGNKYSAKLAQ